MPTSQSALKFGMLILLSILIVLGLTYLKSDTATSQTPHQAVILMEPEKFNPSVIYAKKDDILLFKNVDRKSRWPASNFHPTHGIYPEFDPQHAVNPGGEWNFQFTKAGEWNYHDHLFPKIRGTIIIQK